MAQMRGRASTAPTGTAAQGSETPTQNTEDAATDEPEDDDDGNIFGDPSYEIGEDD